MASNPFYQIATCEVTPIDLASELRERFIANKKKIADCLNFEELVPFLCEKSALFSIKEGLDLLRYQNRTNKVDYFCQRLEKDFILYSTFLDCLKREKEHLGHDYIVALLEGREYASESDITHSEAVKTAVNENLTEFTRGLNPPELASCMTQCKLLTEQERKHICDSQHSMNERILFLVDLLGTKGPFGYARFMQCLQEESSHCTHKELHEITSDEVDKFLARNSCSGKRAHHDRGEGTLCKRNPQQLKLHGPLKSKEYKKLMVTFQTFHHNGEWMKLGKEAETYLTKEDIPTELQIVALLEWSISMILQRQGDEVIRLVSEANKKCTEITGDNSTFLQGRCKYILSRLYRYQKDNERAKEHAIKAMIKLHGTESGEDSAFANYCYACALLESDNFDIEEVKDYFDRAIRATYSCNGLNLVAPHAYMRLAQMHLGSSHYSTGSITNKESIRTAESCLQKFDRDWLPKRSICCLYLIESDLYHSKGMFPESRVSAQQALDVAVKYNFINDRESAENRLSTHHAIKD